MQARHDMTMDATVGRPRRARRWGRRGRMVRVAAVVAGAAVVTSGGAVWASIPQPNGVIKGCYNPSAAYLRVIDPALGQTCTSSERPLDWNQTGPAGPTGPQGPAGPTGPQGPAGPAGVGSTYWNDTSVSPTSPYRTFSPTNPDFYGKNVRLAPLPAGNYNVTATLQIAQGGSGRTGAVYCALTGGVGGNIPRESINLDVWSRAYEYISLRTLVTSNGTTRPELLCAGRTAGAATAWYYMDIAAQPAGQLVRHAG